MSYCKFFSNDCFDVVFIIHFRFLLFIFRLRLPFSLLVRMQQIQSTNLPMHGMFRPFTIKK